MGIGVINFKFVYRVNILAILNSRFLVALSLPNQPPAHTLKHSRGG